LLVCGVGVEDLLAPKGFAAGEISEGVVWFGPDWNFVCAGLGHVTGVRWRFAARGAALRNFGVSRDESPSYRVRTRCPVIPPRSRRSTFTSLRHRRCVARLVSAVGLYHDLPRNGPRCGYLVVETLSSGYTSS